MIKFIKSLFWPKIYEPVYNKHDTVFKPMYFPDFKTMEDSARRIANGEDAMAVCDTQYWYFTAINQIMDMADEMMLENGRRLKYHREGYAFAHKKYWGT